MMSILKDKYWRTGAYLHAVSASSGTVGKMWPMVDYMKKLKIQQMQVKNIYLTAMILRNAFVTINGGITAEYFKLVPPTFGTWTSQGPRILA